VSGTFNSSDQKSVLEELSISDIFVQKEQQGVKREGLCIFASGDGVGWVDLVCV